MINDIENNELENTPNFLFYSGKDGKMHVQIILNGHTVWTTQKGMSEIFGVEVPAINDHSRWI